MDTEWLPRAAMERDALSGRSFDPKGVDVFLQLHASGEFARIREQTLET